MSLKMQLLFWLLLTTAIWLTVLFYSNITWKTFP
jgi:hypothetical protein